MRGIVLSLFVLMPLPNSAGADIYIDPAEYLYPELTESLAKNHSLRTMHTCEEATRIEAKGHEFSASTPLMDDVNSHVVFWNKGSEILSMQTGYVVPQLSDASEKYLSSLLRSPNQKNFTARDKLFLIEHGWASRVRDKKFVHSAVYSDCNAKMREAISDYLASKSKKGEG